MKGLTNYITESSWEDIIMAWFVHIDYGYKEVIAQSKSPLRTSGPEPKMSDSEVITVSLIIETFLALWESKGYTHM